LWTRVSRAAGHRVTHSGLAFRPVALSDDLVESAQRWAAAALDAYSSGPQTFDFAVHHMAIAVEHQAKAFLCSISGALLADKLDVDDLVLLTGNQDRVVSRRLADVKTISASAAHDRVAKLRRQKGAADALGELREARNGITHLGAWEARDVRRILAAGITYIDDLLADADRDRADFWGRYATLAAGLVDQAKDEAELRYENKLDRARRRFEERFGGMPEEERATAITRGRF
jgi:hypothetical protein